MLTPEALLWPTVKALLWIVLGFCAYAFLLRRLATAVQPLRLRLAEEGEALLADGVLSPDDEVDVHLFLDNAFNGWAVVFLMLMMPGALLLLAKDSEPEDEPPAGAVSKLSGLFAVSIFAANPLMGALAVMEFLVIAVTLVVWTGSLAALRAAIRGLFHRLASWRIMRHAT